MRPRRGPQFASATFALVVVLAVAALVWGASHNSSQGNGVGSAKDQAAARTTLAALKLPDGFARDASFTACGNIADSCLTSRADVAATLTSLTTIVRAAGGTLPDTCSASITSSDTSATAGPRFTCGAEARLHGTEVFFLLGGGWSLPGNPTPRTAVLVTVVSATNSPVASPHDPTPGSAADADLLVPTKPIAWASGPQACAGGSTPPESAPASSAPAASTPSPSAAADSTPVLVTTPPLPPCAATALTDNVSVHLALGAAAAQLSNLALGQGFRLDGHPCSAGATSTSCTVRGERIAAGVQQVFVAALTDDGRGDTVGTLAVTRQTQK